VDNVVSKKNNVDNVATKLLGEQHNSSQPKDVWFGFTNSLGRMDQKMWWPAKGTSNSKKLCIAVSL